MARVRPNRVKISNLPSSDLEGGNDSMFGNEERISGAYEVIPPSTFENPTFSNAGEVPSNQIPIESVNSAVGQNEKSDESTTGTGIGNVEVQNTETVSSSNEEGANENRTSGGAATPKQTIPQKISAAVVQGIITGLGATAAGLVAQILNRALFGTPGEQALAFMNEAFPGTNAWERLGGSSGAGQMGQAAITERMHIRTEYNKMAIAQLQMGPAIAKTPSEIKNIDSKTYLNDIEGRYRGRLLDAGITRQQTSSVFTFMDNVRTGKLKLPAQAVFEDIAKFLGTSAAQMEQAAKDTIVTIINEVQHTAPQAVGQFKYLIEERQRTAEEYRQQNADITNSIYPQQR